MDLIFDFSFIELFIKDQNDKKFLNHKSMDIIYSHYLNYNSNKPVLTKEDLLKKNINSFSGKSIQDLITTKNFVKNNTEKWKNIIIHELKKNSPISYVCKSTVFFSIGYDMGIAFNDNVVIDLSFSYYQEFPEEILYFIIHELSHVVVYTYHKPLNFSLVKIKKDILDIVRFHTLLEGLGVFFPYELRKKDKNLIHKDYQNLSNKTYLEQGEKRLTEILLQLEHTSDKGVEEKDWQLIGELSETRYWYVIGAKMALDIEKKYGKEKILNCIVEGEELFFRLYQELR